MSNIEVLKSHERSQKIMKTKITAILAMVILLSLFVSVAVFAGTINYTYDNAGRLTGADYGDGKTIAFTYDNNGNLLERDIQVPGPQEYVYVNKDDETCGENSPCYQSIQEGMNNASTGADIRIAKGEYDESLILSTGKTLTLDGCWNSSFSKREPNTTEIKAPRVTDGSLKLRNIVIKP
jgi:YD repeat-containing protein